MLVWADCALDREAVWERLDQPLDADDRRASGPLRSAARSAGWSARRGRDDPHCPRCDTALHRRKPNSIARTWALVIAAAMLYVPANYYPVLTVMQLGAG